MIDHDRYCPTKYGTIKDTIFEPMKPLYEKEFTKFTAHMDWWPSFGIIDPSLPPQFLAAPSSLPECDSLPSKLRSRNLEVMGTDSAIVAPLRWTLVDGRVIWTKIEDETVESTNDSL